MKPNLKLDKIEISEEKKDGTEKFQMLKETEKNVLTEKSIDLSKEYLSENQKSYKILKYANNCEEHNQISFILPLIKSTKKFILYIILNIFTIGIINLFMTWFPKMNLYLYYDVTTLN